MPYTALYVTHHVNSKILEFNKNEGINEKNMDCGIVGFFDDAGLFV